MMTIAMIVVLLHAQVDPNTIIARLNANAESTWIPAGTIQGQHIQYRAPKTTDRQIIADLTQKAIQSYSSDTSKPQVTDELQQKVLEAIPFNVQYKWLNESTTVTSEQVVYDGSRFRWTIDVLDRQDSIRPDSTLSSNPMCDAFNMAWNRSRVFAWDGRDYIAYFVSANRAFVDSTDLIQPSVNGPLTAGLISWGSGLLSPSSLANAKVLAKSTAEDERFIELDISWTSGTRARFVLDQGLDLAVYSAEVLIPDKFLAVSRYGDHVLVGGRWVPRSIYTEQRDPITNRLIGYDQWTIELIDTKVSVAWPVRPKPGTLVQHRCTWAGQEMLIYEYNQSVDIDRLLGLVYPVVADRQASCGARCLRLVSGLLDRPIQPPSERLVTADRLVESARAAGLDCRTVRLDLGAISRLAGCVAILYLPARSHFVVLAGTEPNGLWIVDPSSRVFLYRVDPNGFAAHQWEGQMAIVFSRQSIDPDIGQDLSAEQVRTIRGAEGYTCTRELQRVTLIPCEWVNYICIGNYWYYLPLYGCEQASSGYCVWELLEARMSSPCLNNLYNPYFCDITGEWTVYLAWACGYEPSQ